MAELEELEQEELDKNLLEISGPETVPLPNVPSIAIPSKPGTDGPSPEPSWVVKKPLSLTASSSGRRDPAAGDAGFCWKWPPASQIAPGSVSLGGDLPFPRTTTRHSRHRSSYCLF